MAVWRLFDSDYDFGAIRPKRPRGPDVVGRGERSRALLAILREGAGEPLSTAEVVHQLVERGGQDVGDWCTVAWPIKRVGDGARATGTGTGASWADVALALTGFGREQPVNLALLLSLTVVLLIVLMWWPVRLLCLD